MTEEEFREMEKKQWRPGNEPPPAHPDGGNYSRCVLVLVDRDMKTDCYHHMNRIWIINGNRVTDWRELPALPK